ncbi:co-chaperone GroES [Candidatus Woesebacteria bacterium]|nr:co-chaperone GroES [Candidatus Woesebacteria bacterium]
MKKLSLKPAPGYLLIEPLEAQTKTASGIYLPDSAGEKPQKGTVRAVGDEETLDNGTKRKPSAKVGDSVIYKKWGGNEYKIDNKEYMFVKFEDILAVEE